MFVFCVIVSPQTDNMDLLDQELKVKMLKMKFSKFFLEAAFYIEKFKCVSKAFYVKGLCLMWAKRGVLAAMVAEVDLIFN